MEKTFSTLAVASACTGIGLGTGINFSLLAEIADQVMGFPVWTHELGDKVMTDRIHDAIRRQFPNMPTREEAEANWQAAAAKATAAYGETVTVARGTESRTEGPVESLARMTGRPEDIIVVSPEASS